MKSLILTEKPSVAREFATALGISPSGKGYFESEKYVVTWAIGHLLTPYDPDDYNKALKKWSYKTLPIIPEKFKYKVVKKTAAQFKIVSNLLLRKDLARIILATDAGREGEVIARTILHKAKFSGQVYRFWTSQALTKQVIQETILNLHPISRYNNLYYAGLARQRADWLVGMNLSRAATLSLGELFSIGRVQTAVLGMLTRRREEIDNFTPTPYWNINAKFRFDNNDVEGIWTNAKTSQTKVESFDRAKEIAAKVLNQEAIIISSAGVKKIVNPPELFSITELQREANSRFSFSAKKTLDITQALYEKHKCVSYPRSDSTVLGTTSLNLAQEIISKLRREMTHLFSKFNEKALSLSNRKVFNDAKLTDHHAIIPLKPAPRALSHDEEKIFDLIVRRFIMAFSIDCIKYDDVLKIQIENELFRATGTRVEEVGFTILDKLPPEKFIPLLPKGSKGAAMDVAILNKKTIPPFEYSENTLLKDMANPSRMVDEKELKKIFSGDVGLGTQSTRANIIETLLARKYARREKKMIIATEKGIRLIKEMQKMRISHLLSLPEETAKWELQLAKISYGEENPKLFLENIENYVKEAVQEWQKVSL